MLRRYQMHTHLRIATRLFFVHTFQTKLSGFLYIRERFFYCFTLAIAARERWVNRDEKPVFVLLDDNREPAMGMSLFH